MCDREKQVCDEFNDFLCEFHSIPFITPSKRDVALAGPVPAFSLGVEVLCSKDMANPGGAKRLFCLTSDAG